MNIIRDITIKAKKYLDSDEMLIFIGARQAGKTTILKQLKTELETHGRFCHFLNLENPEYLSLLNKNPQNLFKIFQINLNKKNFVFIDEIQYLENPSNFLKFIFDEYQGKIKLIISGSSAFYIDKKFKDSLAGRKKIFNVFTLSFKEFLRFKNEKDLSQKDFKKLSLEEKNKISLYYREFMIYGGYPRVVLAAIEEKEDILRELAYSYIKKDIYEANIKQEEVFYKLFKIFANQIGSLVNMSELANTLNVSKTTIDNYLYVMNKSNYIALINPFSKNIRKEITKMPKIFFFDTGLRNCFAGNFESFDLRNDKGQLLENAVFRQLIENNFMEEIRFWRTINQQEVDFVIGEKFSFEVKIDASKFNSKKISLFLETYPKIKFCVIAIDVKENIDSVINVWEI